MQLQVIIKPGMDGWFVAEVPSLPGCISQGKTEEEALENIREAIELYLEPDEEDYILSEFSHRFAS
ncbi:type II toxin-antitoxin system HicB family antitoxin [Methanoplanus endosymbiosus]|uniref:Type II toxin-antitoxin system HicB family antitoxin n=1 Tax=Methanoplanus endosymbiosus TaxID=33865 RepID=A0A9E7TJ87_9EURY|nr:type II toxin-antitoxin system HicB family antitoxin [Methanoplanus endosymbiosus]UUX91500.1 type II toxin-antitoxin system HicB family antitoxin [Methanoplanus endosymbiosus]